LKKAPGPPDGLNRRGQATDKHLGLFMKKRNALKENRTRNTIKGKEDELTGGTHPLYLKDKVEPSGKENLARQPKGLRRKGKKGRPLS